MSFERRDLLAVGFVAREQIFASRRGEAHPPRSRRENRGHSHPSAGCELRLSMRVLELDAAFIHRNDRRAGDRSHGDTDRGT